MGINGIGVAGYPVTGYTARKAERSAESGAVGFMETVTEKAEQDKKVDYDEKAFASVGANAPEEVKQAWLEAAKAIGANGLGMSGNGMLTHLSQMMVQRAENWMNGIGGTNDILGSTVQSAIKATEQALYDLDHPLSPDSVKSIEVQRQQVKERAFYQLFLDKLGALV
ncbi:MAG: hypothetical protein HFI10_06000 [Lachnospiraceae bacterium]|jgi:hypothetical protein|nr:hypothetical protein [Lachnospiraceae bacterium]